jgi:uncharacterized membrane protein YgdD (TMEM256/DUF423 family)
MIMTSNRALVLASCLGGTLSVALGAFAAHGAEPGLKALLSTGSHYLILHALFALACATWRNPDRLVTTAGWLALSGGLVFCLSLVALGLTGITRLGAITPIGGLMMIVAWLFVAFAAFRTRSVFL